MAPSRVSKLVRRYQRTVTHTGMPFDIWFRAQTLLAEQAAGRELPSGAYRGFDPTARTAIARLMHEAVGPR
ncbi:hypothetical protein [Nocardioides sp. GY 10127]|uniref:hypothetical protein n=1 Tax=Nocardioides sp. GY 10127 TaxID=2569762 RepID=UPI0010A7B9CC|nr:hypothetical protein [Nocardioides sp. GY 10127]TIC84106.1 hypothetical protein E8D37_04675 [Nocardioides sp. GY 10127]